MKQTLRSSSCIIFWLWIIALLSPDTEASQEESTTRVHIGGQDASSDFSEAVRKAHDKLYLYKQLLHDAQAVVSDTSEANAVADVKSLQTLVQNAQTSFAKAKSKDAKKRFGNKHVKQQVKQAKNSDSHRRTSPKNGLLGEKYDGQEPTPPPTPQEWPRNSVQCNVNHASFTECLESFDTSCSHGVGANSPNQIPDEAITASSTRPEAGEPHVARLDQSQSMPWVPETDFPTEWVQYYLGESRLITGMKLQGADPDCTQHPGIACKDLGMKAITLWFSTSGRSWSKLSLKDTDRATPLEAIRSNGDTSTKQYTFPSSETAGMTPFEAAYVRIYIFQAANWGKSTIRADFFGPQCQMARHVPVGISSGSLPDSGITENPAWPGSRASVGEGPAAGRLHGTKHWGTNYKGYGSTPTGDGFQGQLWIQVDLGSQVTIGAVATQGRQDYAAWTTQYKVKGSLDAVTYTEAHTGILDGNTDKTTVVKHYLTPFTARHVRLYVWGGNNGNANALRMELYAVSEPFNWSGLSLSTSHGAVGSDSSCNETMHDLMPAFGDGASSLTYVLTAYQRRRLAGLAGLLSKQLVCFKPDGGSEKCCVQKSAVSLDRGSWDMQEDEVKLA